MTKLCAVPITRLEATLDLRRDPALVIVPPMPTRRRVTIEEFEADMRAVGEEARTTDKAVGQSAMKGNDDAK